MILIFKSQQFHNQGKFLSVTNLKLFVLKSHTIFFILFSFIGLNLKVNKTGFIYSHPSTSMYFFMLVLLRRTSFLTTFYGLYFSSYTSFYNFPDEPLRAASMYCSTSCPCDIMMSVIDDMFSFIKVIPCLRE